MALSITGQFYVRAGGELLAENVGLELRLDGDDKDVFTTVLGFAGQTSVPKKVVCKLDDVILLSSRPAFDPWKLCLDGASIEFEFIDAGTGRTLTTEGFIRNPNIQAGVDRTPANGYEFHGRGVAWEGGLGI